MTRQAMTLRSVIHLKRVFQVGLFIIACAFAQVGWAQSGDQSLPTPILSNDVNGKIPALDLGDPRATRHFYAFAASPGDLLIAVDSKNLDGDVDVFTAITFRPLMKTSVYATSQSLAVTKGIYLRAHQILILRVEARTPNDDPGTYHIHFGGTFEPFSGGIPVAENTETTETSSQKAASNRLSSVGANIPRPPAEVTETAEAKPSPSPEKTLEKPSEVSEVPKPEAGKPPTTARTNTTRPPRRGTRPATSRKPPPKKTETPRKVEDTAESPKTESVKTEPEPKEPAVSETAKPQEIAPLPSGTRLIIEQKDGTRIERPMSTVRRVIIEGPTIVVLLKTGKIERIAMADVAKMSIEPQ
jgi:hypothetical protein